MRNKRRIDLVLDQIERLWESSPDLRYFQLMDVLGTMYLLENDTFPDVFYLEDDKFLQWLKTAKFE